jgi:prophage regulatory protein
MLADSGSRILRLKTVLDRTGLTRSTLYRKIERGTFPKQVQISERCVGWRESEIDAWLRNPIFYQRKTEKYDLLGLGLND